MNNILCCCCKIDFSSIVTVTDESSKLDDKSSELKWTTVLVDSATKCNLDLKGLYDLYGVLSDDIHGAAWSGPAVQIMSSLLKAEYSCFIENLSKKAFNFQVEKIQ